jgi:hypothetical protein
VLKELLADALFLIGVVLAVYGVWLLSHPAAFLLAGVAFIWISKKLT